MERSCTTAGNGGSGRGGDGGGGGGGGSVWLAPSAARLIISWFCSRRLKTHVTCCWWRSSGGVAAEQDCCTLAIERLRRPSACTRTNTARRSKTLHACLARAAAAAAGRRTAATGSWWDSAEVGSDWPSSCPSSDLHGEHGGTWHHFVRRKSTRHAEISPGLDRHGRVCGSAAQPRG